VGSEAKHLVETFGTKTFHWAMVDSSFSGSEHHGSKCDVTLLLRPDGAMFDRMCHEATSHHVFVTINSACRESSGTFDAGGVFSNHSFVYICARSENEQGAIGSHMSLVLSMTNEFLLLRFVGDNYNLERLKAIRSSGHTTSLKDIVEVFPGHVLTWIKRFRGVSPLQIFNY
jgi:hypothetical protein